MVAPIWLLPTEWTFLSPAHANQYCILSNIFIFASLKYETYKKYHYHVNVILLNYEPSTSFICLFSHLYFFFWELPIYTLCPDGIYFENQIVSIVEKIGNLTAFLILR